MFLFRSSSPGEENVDMNIKPIYSFVQECIKDTGEDAIERIGETGGYYLSPEKSLENGIAYYLYNEKNALF